MSHNFAPPGSEPRVCFHRYNLDGYGQKANGQGWKNYPGDSGDGIGGPWPLLAGERAHYEIALKGNPGLYLRSFESFATQAGLFPEQVWTNNPQVAELPDGTSLSLVPGGPTGAAVPLVWAHAEYVKLVHSLEKGKVVDLIPEVAKRYITRTPAPTTRLEFWTFQRKDDPVKVRRDQVIRIPVDRPFQLHWSNDSWATVNRFPFDAIRRGSYPRLRPGHLAPDQLTDRLYVLLADRLPLGRPEFRDRLDPLNYWGRFGHPVPSPCPSTEPINPPHARSPCGVTCTRIPPVPYLRLAGRSSASLDWPQQPSSGSSVVACQRASAAGSSVRGSGPGSAYPAATPEEQRRASAPGSTLGPRSQTEVGAVHFDPVYRGDGPTCGSPIIA